MLNPVRLLPPAALALCFVFDACIALAQHPVLVAPAAAVFEVGDLEVEVLRDGALAIPNDGSVFGLNVTPDSVRDVLRAAASPRSDTISLDIDALLVHTPAHVVLIDAGYGTTGHGVLRKSLALDGVAPGDVTDVLITHAHPDHVNGLVDEQGHSAFSNAKIRMSAKDWQFMRQEAETRPIAGVIASQVVTFEPGSEVLPGITALALYGHTPGHVMYEIRSRGESLVDLGDAAHSSIVSLARPDWTNQWDVDKAAGARQRRQELTRVAVRQALIFAPHFPYPGVGHIERRGAGFRFRPEQPTREAR